jgi:hypothetical protein
MMASISFWTLLEDLPGLLLHVSVICCDWRLGLSMLTIHNPSIPLTYPGCLLIVWRNDLASLGRVLLENLTAPMPHLWRRACGVRRH